MPVLVCFLHGQLAPAAWAAAQAAEGIRAGYVQTPGGALPGSFSRDVAELRERGLLAGHLTAGPAYGGEGEAISVPGAIDAAAGMGWDAVIAGPGPGNPGFRLGARPRRDGGARYAHPRRLSACRRCLRRASPAATPARATAA